MDWKASSLTSICFYLDDRLTGVIEARTGKDAYESTTRKGGAKDEDIYFQPGERIAQIKGQDRNNE